jgi:hypothetical protein
MNTDNTQDGAEPSPASAGSQPVAWAVIPGTVLAGRAWRVTLDREEAEQLSCGAMLVVPLYEQPQPTLTDAEREAVAYFSEWCLGPSERLKRYGDTLRSLLERLG